MLAVVVVFVDLEVRLMPLLTMRLLNRVGGYLAINCVKELVL